MNPTPTIDRFVEIFNRASAKAPELIVIFLVGIVIIRIAKLVLHSVIRVSKVNQAMKDILISVVDIALWILLIAALLQQMGQNQIAFALSSTVAIAGIAISIGSSSFIQDLVAGVFLAQDPDFKIGDTLKTEQVEGVVERMDSRKVRIRDKNGLLHVLPNSNFDRASWIVVAKKSRGGGE